MARGDGRAGNHRSVFIGIVAAIVIDLCALPLKENAMPQPFKVAAVQAAPSFLDVETGVRRAVGYIEEAAKGGAKLVVFPETWLPGYPNHIWLGPVAWGMKFVGRYFENSIVAGSGHDRAIAKAARDNNIQGNSLGLAAGSSYP